IVAVGGVGGGPASLFGVPFDYPDPEFHYFMSKHAPDGSVLWVNFLQAQYGIRLRGLAIDSNGNFATCGDDYDNGFVHKYDPEGNLLWASVLGGAGQETATSVDFAPDGDLVAGGFSDYGAIFIDSLEINAGSFFVGATLRYGPNGDLEWYDAQPESPNHVFIAPGGEITAHEGLTRFRHFDASGSADWTKEFVDAQGFGQGFARFTHSARGPGGDIFAAGELVGSLEIDGFVLENLPGHCTDFIFARIGSDGILQWATLARPITDYDCAGQTFDVAVDGQGNSFVLGETAGPMMFDGTAVPALTVFLVSHDPAGNQNFVCLPLVGGIGLTTVAVSPFNQALLLGGMVDGPQTVAGISIDPEGDANHGYVVSVASPLATGVSAPHAVARLEAYPNPFNPRVTIRYSLPYGGEVQLDIHSVDGAHVRSLVRGYRAGGAETAAWDGRDARGRVVGSGVYFAVLRAGGTRLVQKVTLLK
ncbi:MAG TPA: hypothetical protein VFT13_03405, partial [Candidatus Krumholzibacteria bacterium]|nr:hypothetical protein [Candidatus Krumholzibacteria bacterium]